MRAGKDTYFLNTFEGIAYHYEPTGNRYFAKYYGRTEYEVYYNLSGCLFWAVEEGRRISRTMYENYHYIKRASVLTKARNV